MTKLIWWLKFRIKWTKEERHMYLGSFNALMDRCKEYPDTKILKAIRFFASLGGKFTEMHKVDILLEELASRRV